VDERLDGCLLKLNRAKTHLEKLQCGIQSFRDEGNYRLIRKPERKEGRRIVFLWDAERTKPFPSCWPILVGEALYQIHSALDHLAWQLGDLESPGKPPHNVTFPIFTSHTKFWLTSRDGSPRQSSGHWLLDRMPADVASLILDVQPYMAGQRAPKHPLGLLYALSNEDKHKTLHIAASAATAQRLQRRVLQDLQVETFQLGNRGAFDDRAEDVLVLYARITGPKPKIDVKPGVVFKEVFGRTAPEAARGELVFDTLARILNYVSDDVFSARFIPYFSAL
jgi:hypothetical protein